MVRWVTGQAIGGGVLLCLATVPCFAGAWTQPQGQGQIIFASTASMASKRFNRSGRLLPTARFQKSDSTLTVDYGLTPDVTLIAGSGFQRSVFAVEDGTAQSVSIQGTGGVRFRLWHNDFTVVSIQASAHAGGERMLPAYLRKSGTPAEAEVRLGIGHSFTVMTLPAFGELQAGYRWRGGGAADELRLDATLGARPIPSILFMIQSFNTITTGTDRRFTIGKTRQHKVQLSAVYDATENWSVQIGVFTSLKGRETLKEQGALLALWRKL
jgi:protein XagA